MDLCWCGNKQLDFFSEDYRFCQRCQTLVSTFENPHELANVENDESDFYGKNYWLEESKDFPDIYARSRNDLSERNLHWLKYLLEYQLPPAKILEIGCAHGSFLGLLKHIGFDAYGMEMSPWVIEYAKKTFDISMYQAPIENSNLNGQVFDVIAMMDVIEHLSDPFGTLQKCIEHLSPNGFFLIQVPCFPNHLSAKKIINEKHPFKQMMMPDEHIYLFSQDSIKRLFNSLGFNQIEFLPAIFSHYDMFLIASRVPLKKNSMAEIDDYLTQTINGRMIQALLDLRKNQQEYLNAYLQLQKLTKSPVLLMCKLFKNMWYRFKF